MEEIRSLLSALQLSVCQETRSPPYSKGSNYLGTSTESDSGHVDMLLSQFYS